MATLSSNSGALQLQDIHLPADAGVWPLAPGWWILLILSILLTVWFVRRALKIIKQKKKHRIILSELNTLQNQLSQSPSNKAISNINILLRKVAISAYSREKIAHLTGAEWLQLLDSSVKKAGFSKGAGRILIDAPYQENDISNLNLAEFIPLIRASIKGMLKKSIKTRGGVL